MYGGFSFNGGRIIEALGLHEDIDEPETDDIMREKETAGFDFGEIYKDSGKSAQKEKDKKKGKRSREVSESEENNGKRTRSSSPIKETEKEKKKSKEKTKPLKIVNKSGTYSNVSTQSPSEEESRWERNNSGTDVSKRIILLHQIPKSITKPKPMMIIPSGIILMRNQKKMNFPQIKQSI